jgi:hypothetical protein
MGCRSPLDAKELKDDLRKEGKDLQKEIEKGAEKTKESLEK